MKVRHFLKLNLLAIFIIAELTVIHAQEGMKVSNSNADIQPLPKGVSVYQLDNGMQVLLIENPALPMVGVNAAVKVGSAYETFSTSGMCHMLEHLLFNGTTSRSQKQLYDDVDLIGGYNNAHTDLYYTDFMMVTPAQNILQGMQIQADMLFNSTLPQDKFEKEKGIVLEEISKSLADPTEQMERNTISVLYQGHSLSLPTLGTYSTIKSLSRDNVYNFYKDNYVPNNIILSVIGNFNTSEILEQIKKIYGEVSPGIVKRDVTAGWSTGFQIPDYSFLNEDLTYYRFYDGKKVVLQLFYELPKHESPKYSELLNLILDKNKDTIQEELKAKFPSIVNSVNISSRLTPVKNFLEADIVLDTIADYNSIANYASNKIAEISFRLKDETVQFEAAKARTEFLRNIEKPHMFGIYNSNDLVINGVEAVLASYYSEEYYKAATELADLQVTGRPLIIIQSPSNQEESNSLTSSNDAKLYKGITGGPTVIVVQNKVSDLLAIHYLIKHKAYYESRYGSDAAKVLHDCIEQRMNSDENQGLSSRYGLTYVFNDNPFIPMDNIYLHPDFGYIRVEGLADDLKGVIDYLNSQFLNFTPTKDEFEKAMEQSHNSGMMGMGGDKAKKLFDNTFESLIYEPNPYSKTPPELTYENLVAFSKEYFQPSNMIISVVSPYSPDEVNARYTDYKGITTGEEPPVYSKGFLLSEKDTSFEKDLQGQRSYLFWGFTTKIDPKDAPALQALSLMLSDNIVFDIREKQGLAYNMSAGIDVQNDIALFYISQGTRPQNVDTLISQYPKFFTSSAVDTLTEEGLQKSLNMYLGRMMFRRLSSINKAYYLANSLYFHNDYNYDNQFFDELKKVKLADVKEAANKYMHVLNPVRIVIR